MQVFKEASRLNLKFKTTKGELNVIDLWQLSPNTLADYEYDLKNKLSLVNTKVVHRNQNSKKTDEQKLDELRLAIVSDILNTLEQESNEAKTKAEVNAKKQELLELLQEKKKENLKNLSEEEILERINSLQ